MCVRTWGPYGEIVRELWGDLHCFIKICFRALRWFKKRMWNWDHPNPLLKSGDAKMESEASPEDKGSWSPPGDGEIIEFGLCDCGPSGFGFFFGGFLISLCQKSNGEYFD